MTKQLDFGPSSFVTKQAGISALPFKPHRAIRNGMVQTLVSSYAPRSVEHINYVARPILLDAGPDKTGYDLSLPVRLLAYYNSASELNDALLMPAPDSPPDESELVLGALPDDLPPVATQGLVMMLHGWGGCSHSPYNMVVTHALLENGFDVVRLNLRDHGPGIHADPNELNKGVFYGTLMDEVVTATQRVAEMAGERPFYIVGASMGGSFATRLAIRHSVSSNAGNGEQAFNNLRRVVAVCPSVNPRAAAKTIDKNLMFRRYFRNLWVKSLRRKEELFPELYNFAEIDSMSLLTQITDRWLPEFSQHADAAEYYAEYQVTREKIEMLNVPLSIVAARDDAVIPYQDIEALGPHPYLDVHIEQYGGHVGFVDLFPFRHRLPQIVSELLASE